MTRNMPFGAERRAEFLLAPGLDHLNHGSYGATPRAVLAAQDEWRARLEANPSGFFMETLPEALRTAAARVARAFGGSGEDWAFVENATDGVNAVLASFDWRPGDEVIVTSQVYGAVNQAIRHHAGRHGVEVVPLPLPVPFVDADRLLAAAERLVTPRTRLAVLDHVTSTGATVLPVERLTRLYREAGVPVLIDGAHAPGQLALDVPAIGGDWYVGNLHKWCFAPKGCAVFWAAPGARESLHPTVISHPYGQGFPAEFDYVGTRDPTPWLTAPAALDWLDAQGAEAVRAHNDTLAREMADMLARAWGTEISAAPEHRAAMATVRLPRTGGGATDWPSIRALTRKLIAEHRVVAPVMVPDGRLWVRISAQIYNEPADYERLVVAGRML